MIDYFNCSSLIASNAILELIHQALGSRMSLINYNLSEKLKWSVNSLPKSIMEIPSILIGLVFGEKYDQELIKGPESTNLEVYKFSELVSKNDFKLLYIY